MKSEALRQARELIRRRPDLRPDVRDIIELMEAEIDDGSPEEHEVELALDSLRELEDEGE